MERSGGALHLRSADYWSSAGFFGAAFLAGAFLAAAFFAAGFLAAAFFGAAFFLAAGFFFGAALRLAGDLANFSSIN